MLAYSIVADAREVSNVHRRRHLGRRHPERDGFVVRASCDSDRRVVYAVLTDAGLAKLNEATNTHFAQIDELFAERFDEDDLETVTGLLTRLAEPAA